MQIPAVDDSECQQAADCVFDYVASTDCQQGQCAIITCDDLWADCNGVTADGCETPLECAECGHDCSTIFAHGRGVCRDTKCVLTSCDSNYADCNLDQQDGCESQLNTTTHCASCLDNCQKKFEHASAICQNRTCYLDFCVEGFADCDQDPATGCESSFDSAQHCGICYNSCATHQNCAEKDGSYVCRESCPDADLDGYTTTVMVWSMNRVFVPSAV